MTGTLQPMQSQLAWVVRLVQSTTRRARRCINPTNIQPPCRSCWVLKKDEPSYYKRLQTVKKEILSIDREPRVFVIFDS